MTQIDPRTVQGYFNTIAGRYDVLNTVLSFGMHVVWKRRAVRSAEPVSGQRILDLCGGTADLALRATRACPGTRVWVYDFSRAMLAVGRTKARAERAELAFVQGDALRLALPDGAFDCVLIGFGLRNLADREAGFSEIYRVLRPGGRVVCLEFSHPQAPWFARLYRWYARHLIPVVGSVVAGARDAYAYLPASIEAFPGPVTLAAMMTRAGFRQVSYRLLSGGIAALHLGEK